MYRVLIIFGLFLLVAGCNSDPRCRREISLLRTEILDLEDKYYVIREQRDDALALLNSRADTALVAKRTAELNAAVQAPLRSHVYRDNTMIEDGMYEMHSHEIDGEVIYEDHYSNGHEFHSDGGIIYEVQQPAPTPKVSPNSRSVIEPNTSAPNRELQQELIEQIDPGEPIQRRQPNSSGQPVESPLGQSGSRTSSIRASTTIRHPRHAAEDSPQPASSSGRVPASQAKPQATKPQATKPEWKPVR